MTVTNSNLNISQLSLQSLKEENFSDIPLSEPPRLSNNKYTARRVLSSSQLHTSSPTSINNSNNRSSPNIVGLGIRRPSDSILNDISKRDRPFSNYSTTSASSDTSSSQDEFNSRVSSLTSYTTSPFISPVIPDNGSNNSKQLPILDYKRVNKTTVITDEQQPKSRTQTKALVATPPKLNTDIRTKSSPQLDSELTPQQRYRLRRTQSKPTLKDIEKRYDDYGSDDEIIDDNLWNVPIAIGGAATFFANEKNCQSPKLVNKVLKSSSSSAHVMQPSKLPGYLHNSNSTPNLPVSPLLRKQSSFAHLSPVAKDISSFYNTSTTDYIRNELLERKSFSETLPLDYKQAQTHGFDDFKMISKEKLKSFSSSRPIWLPPKSSDEVKKHDKQITKVINNAARTQSRLKELQSKKLELDKVNIQRFENINNKEYLKSKHVRECGNLLFETKIPPKIEFNLLVKLSLKLNPSLNIDSIKIEYHELVEKINFIDFTTRTREFEKISNSIMKNYPIFQDELSDEFKNLQQLIKLNQISDFETFPYLTSKLLMHGFSNQQIYILLKIFNTSALNDEVLSKYYSNFETNQVLKKLLVFVKDDLNNLSFKLFLSVLPKDIMIQFLEILICLADYKLCYALILTVLRDYHFGYNNVKDLIVEGKEIDFETPINTERFLEKLKFYYKKF